MFEINLFTVAVVSETSLVWKCFFAVAAFIIQDSTNR